MKGTCLYVCVVLAAFSCQVARAQDRWDEAMDRYELICGECLRLRTMAANGQTVPADDLSTLLGELSTLRRQLRQAEGNMSVRQQIRFEQIRQHYSVLFSGRRQVQASLPPGPAIHAPLLSAPCPPPSLHLASRPVYTPYTPQTEPLHYGLLAVVGLPELSLGGMAMFGKGSLRAYIKASATLRLIRAEGYCYSDGTTDDGIIWTSGKTATSRYSVTAGAVWFPFENAGLYAGAGRGSRNRLWQEASGRWLQVQDLSARGLAVDFGVMVPVGHLTLMAGVSSIEFRSVSAEIGLGWSF